VINQPLMLHCSATVVSDINSTVDIIWTTNNTQVRRVNNVTAVNSTNSTSTYIDSFIISSLNISDIGSVYQCEVLVNSFSPTRAKTGFMIPIPGTYNYSYISLKWLQIILCMSTTYIHQKINLEIILIASVI